MDWFATRLLAWHDTHGRKDLPWQQDITPYRVWVSEIMLQQTQVSVVIGYYLDFMARFQDVESLAAAPLDDVLHHWTGLGYYARARNLHKAAQAIVTGHGGRFPRSQAELEALPGIGRSTAGAIQAIAMGRRAPILDGNVKRVLARFHGVAGYPGETRVAKALWKHADEHTPASKTRQYTQAIMDLGATLCTRKHPACDTCPLSARCTALAAGTVEELPTPKPKKDKPVRAARLFVVTTASRATLLEQKPLDGIWGGLWTPPQRDQATETKELLRELHIPAFTVEREHVAPQFRHTFTHYHLDIEPVYLFLNEDFTAVQDREDLRWVFPDSLGANERMGLSKPAVKLLESLQDPFAA